jgi:dCTP deaminase
MLYSDRYIIAKALGEGMIAPFESSLVRKVDDGGKAIAALSFGCCSYGYDLRLSPKEFLVFHRRPGRVLDPKDFSERDLHPVELEHERGKGKYFILPAHSYGLGVAVERLKMPRSVTGICLGKSTYARLGIIVNVTPAEAGWEGHLTLEFSNSSDADCRIYANEGVCQMLFFEGSPCNTSYADRRGKYQGQKERVTLPIV